ncbi:MAG: hypothetical protein ACEQSF_01805 [Solirubrobacteraceae bacterium]
MKFKLTILTLTFFTFFINAQEINIGSNIGLPIGKISNAYSSNLGLDASILWDFDKETQVGVSTGLNYLFGRSLEVGGQKLKTEGILYIPFAATLDYHLYDQFFTGADIGVGLMLRKYDSFKFYFQPKFGLIVSDELKAFSYIRFLDGGTLIGLGFSYNILK